MGKCDNCGNEYEKTFNVMMGDETHTFDSIECAARMLAPKCQTCGTRILGHGVEQDERIYCCAHCARETEFETDLMDHA